MVWLYDFETSLMEPNVFYVHLPLVKLPFPVGKMAFPDSKGVARKYRFSPPPKVQELVLPLFTNELFWSALICFGAEVLLFVGVY